MPLCVLRLAPWSVPTICFDSFNGSYLEGAAGLMRWVIPKSMRVIFDGSAREKSIGPSWMTHGRIQWWTGWKCSMIRLLWSCIRLTSSVLYMVMATPDPWKSYTSITAAAEPSVGEYTIWSLPARGDKVGRMILLKSMLVKSEDEWELW